MGVRRLDERVLMLRLFTIFTHFTVTYFYNLTVKGTVSKALTDLDKIICQLVNVVGMLTLLNVRIRFNFWIESAILHANISIFNYNKII